jgi:tetratricopeptide (TPR) repeat protein
MKHKIILVFLISSLSFSGWNRSKGQSYVSNLNDQDIKYLRGERLYAQAKYTDAQKLLLEYVDGVSALQGAIDPHFSPYLYLGMCSYYAKNYDKAIEYLKKDLEYDGTRALYNLSCTYALKGDKNNAFTFLELIQGSNDALPGSSVLKDPDWSAYLADADFIRITGKRPPPFKVYEDSCNYYYGKGDLDMALKMINECIKLEPGNIKGYHGRGAIYMQKKEYQNAIDAFQKEIDIESDRSYRKVKKYLGYQQKGQALSYLKDFPGSISNTMTAIRGNLTLWMGYMDLASFQLTNKQYDDAKRVMLDYLHIADDDDFGHYLLGLAYLNLGDTKRSTEEAQRAIDLVKAAGSKPPQEYYDLLGK